jgi:hypothetical protein
MKDNKFHERVRKDIEIIWDEINDFLSNFENRLLLFDFTTVSHKEDSKIDVQSIYKYVNDDYPTKLEKYFDINGYSIPEDAPGDNISLYNIVELTEILHDYSPKFGEFIEFNSEAKTIELDEWHKFIEEEKIAGASWIYFKDLHKNTETNERIEIGLYVLLEKPVKGWRTNLREESDEVSNNTKGAKVNNYLLNTTYKLLGKNGIDYLAQEYERRSKELKEIKFKKEQLSREKMLYVGIGHYIKNSMNGLAVHENEIIKHLENDNANQKILLTAQLQRVIYRLIRLYLQLRQNSDLAFIDDEKNKEKIKVNLYSLINLIYLHSIIIKGRFHDAFEDEKSFVKAENLIKKQNDNIDNLKTSLLTDDLSQDKIDDVLSDLESVSEFHRFTKNNYVTQIQLDFTKQIILNLTVSQFKLLYTAIAEIFDNCYSREEGFGITKIYFGQSRVAGFKKLIISSRSSSMSIDKKFDVNNILVEEIETHGNGLKIIKSALENTHMNSKLRVSENSKKFDLPNGGKIDVYEYHLMLNEELFL